MGQAHLFLDGFDLRTGTWKTSVLAGDRWELANPGAFILTPSSPQSKIASIRALSVSSFFVSHSQMI